MALMDKGKFMLTFVVAVAVIMGGYFFANSGRGIDNATGGQKSENKLGLTSPLQTSGSDKADAFQGSGTAAYVPTNAKGNITRMVAQSMFSKMQQMDRGGTNPFGTLDTSDPNTRAMIEETIQSVPGTIFVTAIDTSEIRTTADNSRSSKMRYVEGVSRITKAYFYTAAAKRFETLRSSQELFNNLQQDCFGGSASAKNAELNKVYGDIFTAYKGLVVPSSWVAMHKMILGYFKELRDIYGAFGQCKEDPIRAYVGIDRLPEVYAKSPAIQKMLNEKAIELGL